MAESLTEHQYGDRNVRVLVPPGYIESRRDAYPLLLLHDGQNLFEQGSTAPGAGSWRVDLAVPPLIATGRIPPVVVAGIDHAGDGRIGEFAPTPAGKLGGGGASEYARLVVADILPRLSADYHVRTDPDGIGLGGSSMGGLVTLWMAILFPGFFGRRFSFGSEIDWHADPVSGAGWPHTYHRDVPVHRGDTGFGETANVERTVSTGVARDQILHPIWQLVLRHSTIVVAIERHQARDDEIRVGLRGKRLHNDRRMLGIEGVDALR